MLRTTREGIDNKIVLSCHVLNPWYPCDLEKCVWFELQPSRKIKTKLKKAQRRAVRMT